MRIMTRIFPLCLFLSLATMLSDSTAVFADGYKGWEKESAYNAFYNYKERDSIKGKVIDFKKVTPLPGMDAGTALLLDEGGDQILVHLCPYDYANPSETGIRKGDTASVKGSWAEINGQDVFMAAKVKQGESFEFKVRLTKDGTPFWTMSPEEREKELNSQ